MNKKFSTLLASAMLATAFSANAQFSDNAKKDASILLQDGTVNLSVGTGNNFGSLQAPDAKASELSQLNYAAWKITSTKTSLGKTLYSFVNKATGLALAADPSVAYDGDKVKEYTPIRLGGSATEWVYEKDEQLLVSYGANYVVTIAKQGGDYCLVKAADLTKLAAMSGVVKITEGALPAQLNKPLNAQDLNTLLQSIPNAKDLFFGLTMDPEVSENQENHLTATSLHAEKGTGDYLKLYNGSKDDDDNKQYVVVDTAYYGGTESGRLLKFTYDKFEAEGRNPGSYQFKFEYSPKKDELYVSVASVSYGYLPAEDANGRVTAEALAAFDKEIKEKNDAAYWPVWENGQEVVYQGTSAVQSFNEAKGEYIYMSKLINERVLTVNVQGDTRNATNAPAVIDQNVKITLGTNFSGLTMTTIPDGVYTIQYKASEGNANYKQNEAYALANLAGDYGWAEQAERQDFNHMPAAQWVVKKNGTSNTAAITIKNREFGCDNEADYVLPVGATQFFAVEGSDEVFYINYRGLKDTLAFHKVADELVKDAKLGYKYVSKDDAMVQTFTFNYLHGLALDKYLIVEENGVVRVNEKDGKSSFRLELAATDDHYGYDDALVRNAYYVTDGKNYLIYNSDTKKYMMQEPKSEFDKTPFFLKENNCIDGKHYYALVEAQIIDGYWSNGWVSFQDKDGKNFSVVADNSKVITYVNGVKTEINPFNSKAYAIVKASVDDNTLTLTEGKLNDKFTWGTDNEIRTSAFAVDVDDSPLYRRFNNENLGEKEGTLNLSFVEKIRGEYLMDEWNSKLQDETVDYAGIWNKDKAEGKLAFVVDTAWVNRGLGYIKPQYLISVARNDQEGTPGVPCTYEHNHYDNAGNKVDAAHCSHATQGHDGFRYGKYLVSFGDSAIDNRDKDKNLLTPYMDVTNGYTRVGFVEAIHYGDSLIILTGDYEKADPAKLNVEEIIAAYKKAKTENLIVNLQGDNHKNVTWSFRYVTPSNDAVKTTEEGTANEFLFESNIYEKNGKSMTGDQYVDNSKPTTSPIVSVGGKATKGFAKTVAGSIQPEHAAWLKMQNGCLVLTRGDSKFAAAKTGSDGALIFNAYQKTEEDDFVTSNDEIAAEGIAIVAGNGTVTIQGAAGKSVVITNILGKVVAETVLTSDNATIAVPAGIVAVAVDGEEAVKAIVK